MAFRKFLVTVPLILLMMCGCKQEQETFPKHERVEPTQHVRLPEHPDFQAIREIPVNLEDGAYTTWGVILNQKKLIAREIRVRGEITEVSDDCPAMTDPKKRIVKKGKKREGYKCKGLYIMIRSPENVDKSLMVMGYHPYFHPYLKPGMTLDVTGTYLMKAEQFMRSRDGLILTSWFNNMGVDKKGKFTDDPEKAEQWRKSGTHAGSVSLD
ncbi:MAG: hypothetical protein IIY06_08270 [Proteobacteria bacterium]|nr:hypothetical protein [Pseudomonadota bacterium]